VRSEYQTRAQNNNFADNTKNSANYYSLTQGKLDPCNSIKST